MASVLSEWAVEGATLSRSEASIRLYVPQSKLLTGSKDSGKVCWYKRIAPALKRGYRRVAGSI